MKDAGVTYDGPTLGALFMQTPVMSDMEWPKEAEKRAEKGDKSDRPTVMRIGYIRQGQRVPVIPEPHVKSNCKEGWYELVQGGFVCGRYATIDSAHPRLKIAPHAPDLGTPLPYQYGYNITHGTPLYRTLPSRDERMKLEPWLSAKPKPKPKKEDESASAASYGEDALDGGALTLAKATSSNTIASSIIDPFGLGEDALDAGTPWYMREYTDGGKPVVTLDELKGEGSMARRMVKGFYIALDKELSEKGRWWKSTYGLYAPYERVYVNDKWSKFHGVWLNEEPKVAPATDSEAGAPASERKATPDIAKHGSKSQVAVILYYKAAKYIVSVSRKAVTTGDPIARHAMVKLTGDTVTINGARYDETDEGWWMKAAEGQKTDPGPPPRDLAPGEKWVDVNLKTQMLVAYEGDKAVFVTAVSTGRQNKDDKEKDHRTPPGTFRIREKHIAATMDGDHATDGPYSIEDVPWIMYFNGSYALHGAFWHSNFGRQQSHGCVNLAPSDAKAMFNWTEPRLPENWHAVWSTTEKPGTRVVVHCGADRCKDWPEL
jgi:lipoprotein-anchoring transpeptidase ErfK/SrfK